jgi:hypothetical protein
VTDAREPAPDQRIRWSAMAVAVVVVYVALLARWSPAETPD